MKIINKEDAGIQEVYDIGVQHEAHNFLIDAGVYASNCFNKSHSISYSLITYACAYLKAKHAPEFFCALMTTRSKSLQPKTWASKAPIYVSEANKMDVQIMPPQINYSELGFCLKDDIVFFGFNAIRNVGKTAARSILKARGNRIFSDVYDFVFRVDRTKVTKRVFEALVKSGSFDSMGYDRYELLENVDHIYDYFTNLDAYNERVEKISAWQTESKETEILIVERDSLRTIKRKSEYKRNPERDLTLQEKTRLEELDKMNLRRTPEPKAIQKPEKLNIQRYSEIEIDLEQLFEQANYIGCFLGEHPARLVFPNTQTIESVYSDENCIISGIVNEIKIIKTKRGQKMAFLSVGDETAQAELIMFPKTFMILESQNTIPKQGDLIKVAGRCETTDPNTKIIINKIKIYNP